MLVFYTDKQINVPLSTMLVFYTEKQIKRAPQYDACVLHRQADNTCPEVRCLCFTHTQAAAHEPSQQHYFTASWSLDRAKQLRTSACMKLHISDQENSIFVSRSKSGPVEASFTWKKTLAKSARYTAHGTAHKNYSNTAWTRTVPAERHINI